MSIEKTEAVVVGAGQAGIAMSENLSANGIRISFWNATASRSVGGPGAGIPGSERTSLA